MTSFTSRAQRISRQAHTALQPVIYVAYIVAAAASVWRPEPHSVRSEWWSAALSHLVALPFMPPSSRIAVAGTVAVLFALYFYFREKSSDYIWLEPVVRIFLLSGMLASPVFLTIAHEPVRALSFLAGLSVLLFMEREGVWLVAASFVVGASFLWLDPYLRLLVAPLFFVWARSYGTPWFRLAPMGLAAGIALGIPVIMGHVSWHPASGPGWWAFYPELLGPSLRSLASAVSGSYPLFLLPFAFLGLMGERAPWPVLSLGLGEAVYALWTMDTGPSRLAFLILALWELSVLGLVRLVEDTDEWALSLAGAGSLALVAAAAIIAPLADHGLVSYTSALELDARYSASDFSADLDPEATRIWSNLYGVGLHLRPCSSGHMPLHLSCATAAYPVGLSVGTTRDASPAGAVLGRFSLVTSPGVMAASLGAWSVAIGEYGHITRAMRLARTCGRVDARAWQCSAAEALVWLRLGLVSEGVEAMNRAMSQGRVSAMIHALYARQLLQRWSLVSDLAGLTPNDVMAHIEAARRMGAPECLVLEVRAMYAAVLGTRADMLRLVEQGKSRCGASFPADELERLMKGRDE